MRSSAPLPLTLLLLIAPSLCRADDEDASAMLRRGVELRREHRDREALDQFGRALALSPTPIARAQLALAEQALGRWVEAEQDLMKALEADDNEWIGRNRSALEDALAHVRLRLAWLRVDVNVSDAELRVEGREVPVGVDLRVVAGSALIEARAHRYVPDTRLIDVPPGEHGHVSITLEPLSVQSPPSAQAPLARLPPREEGLVPELEPAPRRESSHAPRSFLGPATLAGAGVVAVAMGTYYEIHAVDERNARDGLCAGGLCQAGSLAHDNEARASTMAATIAAVTGVGSLVASAAWYLTDRLAPPGGQRTLVPEGGPIVLGILGLSGIGLGAYFGIRTFDQRNARDQQCTTTGCDSSVARALDADARRASLASSIATTAGLASLVGSATWWIYEAPPAERGQGREAASCVWPALLGTVGLGSLAVGTYVGLRTLAAKSAHDAQCRAGRCTALGLADDAEASAAATASTVAVVAGLASAAGGAAWWMIDGRLASRGTAGAPPRSVGPLVLAVLGLGSGSTAAYFGLKAYQDRQARDARCVLSTCDPSALRYDADARMSAAVSTAASAAAVPLLALSAALWLRHPSAPGVLTGWRASPRLGSGSASLSLQGDFP